MTQRLTTSVILTLIPKPRTNEIPLPTTEGANAALEHIYYIYYTFVGFHSPVYIPYRPIIIEQAMGCQQSLDLTYQGLYSVVVRGSINGVQLGSAGYTYHMPGTKCVHMSPVGRGGNNGAIFDVICQEEVHML